MSRAQLADLRLREIGVSFGNGPQSSELTVAEYISLPLRAIGNTVMARSRAREALRQADIIECRNALWSQLSDSEKVLASLAHALARQPRLLLVDDPTPRRDARQDYEVVALLRRLADQGMAVIMTTSAVAMLCEGDRACTMGDGRLEEVPVPQASILPFPESGRGSRA